MYKTELNGTTIIVNERTEWKTSISEDFKPGDYVDGAIAWDLINAVPPAAYCGDYFQLGEAYSHRPDKNGHYRPTFITMRKVKDEPEVWEYLGTCFYSELEHQN